MLKLISLLVILSIGLPTQVFGCFSSSSSLSSLSSLDKIIASWKKCNGTNYNNITGNVRSVYYNTTHVFINVASVPDYSIGPWTANPNVPSDQNYTLVFPRTYTKATTKTKVGLGKIGTWINGVSIYNADDGMSYNNLGYWTRNAYVWEGISFDSCYGHAAQNGEYHHHVFPKCIYSNLNSTSHSPILGFAFDGVPIYGPYGYNSPNDTSSGIVRIKTSYKLRNITARTTYSNGTTLTGTQVGPAINSTYPLGAYLEDFEYSSGYGHLDDSNGRWCITPEFPSGTYAYFTTIDSTGIPEYPFVLGTYYYGTPQITSGPSSSTTIPADATRLYICTATTYSGANTLNAYGFHLMSAIAMAIFYILL